MKMVHEGQDRPYARYMRHQQTKNLSQLELIWEIQYFYDKRGIYSDVVAQ